MTKAQALENLEFWTREVVQAYRIGKYPEDGEWVSEIESLCAFWARRAQELGATYHDMERSNAMLRKVAQEVAHV